MGGRMKTRDKKADMAYWDSIIDSEVPTSRLIRLEDSIQAHVEREVKKETAKIRSENRALRAAVQIMQDSSSARDRELDVAQRATKMWSVEAQRADNQAAILREEVKELELEIEWLQHRAAESLTTHRGRNDTGGE